MTETADLEKNPIIAKIRGWRPEAISDLIFFRGETTVVVPREHLHALAQFLISDAEMKFTYLSDVTGVDRFPIEPRFELNYHLLSLSQRERIRLRVRVPGDDPVADSVVDRLAHGQLARARNFRFAGHPLRRASRSAAHAAAGRLGRLSPSQGLSRGGSALISDPETSEPAL